MSAYAHGDLGSSLPVFKCLVCKFEPNNHLKDVGGEGDGDELAIELRIDVPGNNEQLGSSEGFGNDSLTLLHRILIYILQRTAAGKVYKILT